MPGYAKRLDAIVDQIRAIHERGFLAEAIELAKYSLELWESAIEELDDSDGYMGPIAADLQQIHLQACLDLRPDPEALARRLCAWELEGSWDIFSDASETYAEVLGEKGLATYRSVIEEAWNKLPTLKPDQKDAREHEHGRYRITSIMESIARQSGDVGALIDVYRRDLSAPFSFLKIAEAYHAAGRFDEAIDWAMRGLASFKVRRDDRLAEFLAELHLQLGHTTEAMAFAWGLFEASPYLQTYQHLCDRAERAGQWEIWRPKALTVLTNLATQHTTYGAPGASMLVEVYLWEREDDLAWKTAGQYGCRGSLWLTLAARREDEHPSDALNVYMKLVEPNIAQTNNGRYEDAVELMRKVERQLIKLERGSEFAAYVYGLRAKYKIKRNFVKLLVAEGWVS